MRGHPRAGEGGRKGWMEGGNKESKARLTMRGDVLDILAIVRDILIQVGLMPSA